MHPALFAWLFFGFGFHKAPRFLGSILESGDSHVLGAMGAAKNHSSLLHAVANHPAATMLTSRRQRIDRAFE